MGFRFPRRQEGIASTAGSGLKNDHTNDDDTLRNDTEHESVRGRMETTRIKTRLRKRMTRLMVSVKRRLDRPYLALRRSASSSDTPECSGTIYQFSNNESQASSHTDLEHKIEAVAINNPELRLNLGKGCNRHASIGPCVPSAGSASAHGPRSTEGFLTNPEDQHSPSPGSDCSMLSRQDTSWLGWNNDQQQKRVHAYSDRVRVSTANTATYAGGSSPDMWMNTEIQDYANRKACADLSRSNTPGISSGSSRLRSVDEAPTPDDTSELTLAMSEICRQASWTSDEPVFEGELEVRGGSDHHSISSATPKTARYLTFACTLNPPSATAPCIDSGNLNLPSPMIPIQWTEAVEGRPHAARRTISMHSVPANLQSSRVSPTITAMEGSWECTQWNLGRSNTTTSLTFTRGRQG